MFCLHCGNTVAEGDAFCENCGQIIIAPKYIACIHCGQLSEEGDLFCEFCGKRISEADDGYQQPANPAPVYAPPPSYPTVAPVFTPPVVEKPRMLLILLLNASASAAPYFNQLLFDLSRFIISANTDSNIQSALDFAIIQFSDSFSVLEGLPDENNMELSQSLSRNVSYYSGPIREALRMTDEHSRSHSQTYKPWVIMITSGEPSDDITAVAEEVQNMQSADRLRFMALGVLDYNATILKKLTDVVFRQKGTDFASFFEWMCNSIGVIVRTLLNEKPQLPNLEGNVYRDR